MSQRAAEKKSINIVSFIGLHVGFSRVETHKNTNTVQKRKYFDSELFYYCSRVGTLNNTVRKMMTIM
jgi:hypothetical protein